jgi:anti-sigma factor RsiW
MAKLSETDWELINAYADGELPADDTAAISRRLAHDSALAAALAEVQATKAALSLIRPTAVAAVPPPPVRHRFGVRRLALAASVAAAVALGAFYQFGNFGDAWHDAPAELHAALSAKTYVIPPSGALPVISTARIGNIEVFDLSSSRLTLVDVRSTRRDDRDVVAMHYRGRRGCRLTVVALEALPGDPTPLPSHYDGLGARWSVGRAHFYLLASGMDRARFDAITAYAKAESRRLDRGDQLELAMRDATDKAQPCTPPTA